MRNNLLVGSVLAGAALVVVFLSAWLDLELESVALLGVALGAVLALVPDGSPLMRLAGFVGGFVAAWIGYFLRAAALPDSVGGRAVVVAVVILLVAVIAALSMNRIPLWSGLLGAGALAGAYEYTYAAAPPEVASTSVSTATAVLLTVAVGFLAAALAAPANDSESAPAPRRARRTASDDRGTDTLDEMMETSK